MKKVYDFALIIPSFIILTTASVFSFIIPAPEETIILFPNHAIPFVNVLSAALCFMLLFIRNKEPFEYFILVLQSVFTTLTGYETLGLFLYSALIMILFSNGFFNKGRKPKIAILFIFWIIVNLGILPFGIFRFILNCSTSIFFLGFFIYIYKKLKKNTSVFNSEEFSTLFHLPSPGSTLNLADYGLSERQISIVKDYLNNRNSYPKLAEKYLISVSTIKKDMSSVFKKLGVKDLQNLRILLLQYEIL